VFGRFHESFSPGSGDVSSEAALTPTPVKSAGLGCLHPRSREIIVEDAKVAHPPTCSARTER